MLSGARTPRNEDPGDFSKRGVPFHALVDDRLGKAALPGPEQEAGRSDRQRSGHVRQHVLIDRVREGWQTSCAGGDNLDAFASAKADLQRSAFADSEPRF